MSNLLVYVLYVGTVVFVYWRDSRARKSQSVQGKGSLSHSDSNDERERDFGRALVIKKDAQREDQLRALRLSLDSERERDSVEEGEREDEPFLASQDVEPASASSSACSRTYDSLSTILGRPIRLFFEYAFPALHPPLLKQTQSPSRPVEEVVEEGDRLPGTVSGRERDKDPNYVPLWRALTILGLSVFCISLLASAIVFISESFISRLGISTATMGATLVALGSEVSLSLSLSLSLFYTIYVYICLTISITLSLSVDSGHNQFNRSRSLRLSRRGDSGSDRQSSHQYHYRDWSPVSLRMYDRPRVPPYCEQRSRKVSESTTTS